MNFTVLSFISAQMHNLSPLFTNVPSIHIQSCCFSSHFSTILYSNYIKPNYLIEFSSFSSILNTAITINSESIEENVYKKTLVEKGDKDRLEVRRCLFYKCVSKKEGGGIRVGSSTSDIFFILASTGFYQCKALSGDAFYSQTKESVISNICIKKCEKNAFIAKSKTIVNILQASITNSKLDTKIDSNRIEISRINLSSNTNSFNIASTFENSIISNSNFGENTGSSFIVFDSSASRQSTITSCNFINNKYSYLVSFMTSSLTFDRCSFIDDKTSRYVKEDSSFIMNNCVYSEAQNEVNAKSMPKGLLNNPFFSSRSTIMNDIGSTYECWNKMPAGNSDNSQNYNNSSSSKVGKVIGIIIIVGGIVALIVFFAVRYGKNYCILSRRGDQTPLFYTGL